MLVRGQLDSGCRGRALRITAAHACVATMPSAGWCARQPTYDDTWEAMLSENIKNYGVGATSCPSSFLRMQWFSGVRGVALSPFRHNSGASASD